MKFFSCYSSGLFCSPEPFTFVSLLSLSLSLEATCLFYHLQRHLSIAFSSFLSFIHFLPDNLDIFHYVVQFILYIKEKAGQCPALMLLIIRRCIKSAPVKEQFSYCKRTARQESVLVLNNRKLDLA